MRRPRVGGRVERRLEWYVRCSYASIAARLAFLAHARRHPEAAYPEAEDAEVLRGPALFRGTLQVDPPPHNNNNKNVFMITRCL